VAHIVRQRFEEADAASVATLFFDLLKTAKGQAGAALSFATRDAGCYILRGFVFEVGAELIVEFGFDGVASEQSAEPKEKIAEHEALPA